jgi:COMPASS component SWD1
MNLSLVDPFVLAQDCPEVITGRLRESTMSPFRPLQRAVTHC